MADIATLGLAIDSRPATTAAAALDRLAASASPAEASVTRLRTATQSASASLANFQTRTQAVTNDSQKLVAGMSAIGAASLAASVANQKLVAGMSSAGKSLQTVQTQSGLARHELINLSRQVQDVGVSLASGQSPLTVLLQQGAQVGDIFASSKGSVAGFASQLRAMIPTSLLVAGGLVAIGAAAFAAISFWKTFALQLDDTAHIMGVTTSEAAKLQAAASFKGIDPGEFADAMKRVAANVYQAQNGMGDLADLFQANGVKAKTFNDYLNGAANLINKTKDNQQRLNILQALGLPQTQEWVRLLSGGADGLKKATDAAAEFGVENDKLIANARKIDETWNSVWTNIKNGAINAIGGALSEIDKLSDKADKFKAGGGLIGAILRGTGAYNAPGAPRSTGNGQVNVATDNSPITMGSVRDRLGIARPKPDVVDPAAARNNLSLEQQRISALGSLATVTQQVRQAEIGLQLARMQPGSRITSDDVNRIKKYTEAQALGTLQIHAQADSYRIETEALTMDVGAAAAFRAEQERLADFRQRGITLTKDQAAALHDEAAALGAAAQKSNDLRTRMDMATDFTSGFAKDIKNGTSALDALTNGLNRLADQLIDMAAKKLLQRAFGSLGTGGLSGLFGGGTAVASANGNIFAGGHVIPFANGGVVTRPTVFPMANGAGLMGEAGPEAVMPLTRLPSGKLGVASRGNSSPNVKVNVVNNHGGASVSEPTVTDDGNGGLSIDLVVAPLENAMADRMTRGKGSLGKAARGMPSGRLLRG